MGRRDKRSWPPGCRGNAERGLMGARACATPGSSHTPWRQHVSPASEEAGRGKKEECRRPQPCLRPDCRQNPGAGSLKFLSPLLALLLQGGP